MLTDMMSASNMRRVRLLPLMRSNCYLNYTPINNFIPALPTSSKTTRTNDIANLPKIAERVLRPSLKKMETICSDSTKTTAIINKSVRFNVPLTQVLHFYPPPPLDDYPEDDEEKKEVTLDATSLELYLVKGLRDECHALAIALPAVGNYPTVINESSLLSLPNWPSPIHPAGRLISQMVSLESIVWNRTLQAVQGRVLVHNLAYEKKVTVRCSCDDWRSWIDVEAHYKESALNQGLSDENSAFDRYLFEINIPHGDQFSCKMAIRYQTLGQEFWDNNNGDNFTVRSIPPSSRIGDTLSSCGKAIMQRPDNNNKEGLSIISRLNLVEHNNNNHANVHIVSQSTTNRYQLDRFRFSKYGASKMAVPAVISLSYAAAEDRL